MVPGGSRMTNSHGSELVVQRNVKHHCHENGADEIEQAAGKEIKGAGFGPFEQRRKRRSERHAGRPETAKNSGFKTVTLMDCMAAMPLSTGNLRSAAMMNAEKRFLLRGQNQARQEASVRRAGPPSPWEPTSASQTSFVNKASQAIAPCRMQPSRLEPKGSVPRRWDQFCA